MGRSVDENSVLKIVAYECGEFVGLAKEIEKQIKALPSAEPEILRCKDCYHYPSEYADCPMVGWFRNEHDFCSRAERRQE